ncbi:hypothetical protein [Paenibacillus massiliensis]|uniref:hypothetical protein n=1 Tax=Paenibacillus massiliensis TaxID=225917 RepID=UPI00046E8AD8|nr:hypothetical protein [Paenibacillus massiliensis]
MKLKKLQELEELNYIELFPGRLYKGYHNEESIYIDDDSYSFIVAAIKRGFEQYRSFDFFEIEKSQWKTIIQELLILKEIILTQNTQELAEYISIFFIDLSTCKWKLQEYMMINKLELISLIDELTKWIEGQLEVNEIITLIGI